MSGADQSSTSIAPIARHLAQALGGSDADARLAVLLAAEATQAGHVCADLDTDLGWGAWASEFDAARRAAWRARLPALSVVGTAEDWTPLVWDGRRLFLRRYWDYEQRVAAALRAHAKGILVFDPSCAVQLATLFPDAGQRQAAQIALSHRLCLVSGGPGTGKTTTLARLIGLLRTQSEQPLRIALAAPTGKAAARMTEALRLAGARIDAEAQTLHRLLGMRPDGSYQRTRERPLSVDLLVVDEASMIDLALMAHLVDALPAHARLVMLGDPDQLAAVEAGAVFADLCGSAGLTDCVVQLATNFRFDATSGIGRLAAHLRAGDVAAALDLLAVGAADLGWCEEGGVRELIAAARAGYADYLAAVATCLPPSELFERFARFRVLCAHRRDAAAVNAAFHSASEPLPNGTPVMVLRNEPLLRLANGDIGIVQLDPASSVRMVCFPAAAGGEAMRQVPLARLPEWEPAWAMTVHKAQGSEFEHVILFLPPVPSAVTTRELVYTGITRARQRIDLWTSAATLRTAIACRALRMSGLREKLEGQELSGPAAGSC